MQRTEFGGESFEGAQLPGHTDCAAVAFAACRVGVDRLPDTWGAIVGILQQQAVQEGGAAAGQAGDEDRPL